MPDTDIPINIKKGAEEQFQKFSCQIKTDDKGLLQDETIRNQIIRLFSVSQYAAQTCTMWPELLMDQINNNVLDNTLSRKILRKPLQKELRHVQNEPDLMQLLRLFRHRQMLRILWRDINHLATIEETMTDLSLLAEYCIDAALNWLYKQMTGQHGTPLSAQSGEPQHLVVLGLGKLGGRELNFSSDIDLIFCYPEQGATVGGIRETDNQFFFNRLAQTLIRLLDAVTTEGFVFRVDTRLRPYGNSGSLVWSFNAMEQYYQDQGRDWERYALIKARPVGGDKSQGKKLLQTLQPFIYRRYLDFSAVESLREMKTLMHKRVLSQNMQQNIKHSPGSIREIEFIVQSFQIIYGGRKRQLQKNSFLSALRELKKLKLLSKTEISTLHESYLFLRRAEHILQAYQDKQTHSLPVDTEQQAILAWATGSGNWKTFLDNLDHGRNFIKNLFVQLMSDTTCDYQIDHSWSLIWQGNTTEDESIEQLDKNNFQQAKQVHRQLKIMRDSRALQSISQRGLSRVNLFMPFLLQICSTQANPDRSLLRTLPIVEKVLRRTSYLVLLLEHTDALQHLVKLCHESLWIADKIACFPALIDEFLRPEHLYDPPEQELLRQTLSQQLLHIASDDIEAILESLCYFKITHLLRIVVSQITGCMPLMAASNYFTWVAESIIQEVVYLAWHLQTKKYGIPCGSSHPDSELPFIVIGYGKLGGQEMGPDSDLDLVFIHEADLQGKTDGHQPLDNQTFFNRLGQKVIHLLSVQTPLGKLYDVDIRLRPSGNSGLLVSSFNTFAGYQRQETWVWECQALIRARVIAGSPCLAEKFNRLRDEVLQYRRNNESLSGSVKNMRKKMLIFDKTSKNHFDLKYGKGGIIDIEFIVQYAILRWSYDHEVLLKWTDNMRLLDVLMQEKLLASGDVIQLQTIYLSLREAHQRQARQQVDYKINVNEFYTSRCTVISIWNKLLKDTVSLTGQIK